MSALLLLFLRVPSFYQRASAVLQYVTLWVCPSVAENRSIYLE